jgi:hypothetical protein
MYYSGYIQTHCQKNKKIRRADKILPEIFGTTLNYCGFSIFIPETCGTHNIRYLYL